MSNGEEKIMRSQNTSLRAISRILSETINKRSFCVPHIIYDLPLTGADHSVLLVLFKLQDDFLFKSKGHWVSWFFATNALISKYSKKSVSTVKRCRRRLKYIGIIDYRLGAWKTRRATEYRLLFD